MVKARKKLSHFCCIKYERFCRVKTCQDIDDAKRYNLRAHTGKMQDNNSFHLWQKCLSNVSLPCLDMSNSTTM